MTVISLSTILLRIHRRRRRRRRRRHHRRRRRRRRRRSRTRRLGSVVYNHLGARRNL